MSDFEAHFRAGIAAYVLLVLGTTGLTVSVTEVPVTTIALGVISAPFALSGAIFPDIDHHASKPHRWFKKSMAGLACIAVGVGVYTHASVLQEAIPFESPGFILGVLTVATLGIVWMAVKRFITYIRPRHRGITHRAITGLVVSSFLGVAVYVFATFIAVGSSLAILSGVVSGMFFLIGFGSHLYKDGLLLKLKTYTSVR